MIFATRLKTSFYLVICAGLVTISSCKENNNPDDVKPESSANYVVLTAVNNAGTYTSYYTPYSNSLPTGSVNNIVAKTRQQASSGGILYAVGNSFYRNENDAAEPGIEKLQVAADGNIKSIGFISAKTTGRFGYVNDQLAYYLDSDRGFLKLQKFNPGTMQRIGEVDFTAALQTAAVQYERLGSTILAVKGGKLFANLHYGTSSSADGFLDAADDTVRIAVIDLATERVDKVTKFATGNGPQNVGYPSVNPMQDFDDNGDFYFISLGSVVSGSGIFRIKANETEIDKGWSLRSQDFGVGAGNIFAFCTVKSGKIYTRLNTQAIASDFSNLYNEIYDLTIIDPFTKAVTKVTGAPSHYFGGYANQIAEFDDKVYFGCRNTTQNINSLYVIEGSTAKPVFNITAGGDVIGVVKLQ